VKSRDPRIRNPALGCTLGVEDEAALRFVQMILPRDGDNGLVDPGFIAFTEATLLSWGEAERPVAEEWYATFLGMTDDQLEAVAVLLMFAFRRFFRTLIHHPDYEVAQQALPLLQGAMYLMARRVVALRGEEPREAVLCLPARPAPSQAMDRAIVARVDGRFTEERMRRMLDRVCRVPPMEGDGEG
jgi:hypothetical protein